MLIARNFTHITHALHFDFQNRQVILILNCELFVECSELFESRVLAI